MVVFVDGLPQKDQYRIFKIRWPRPPLNPPLGKGGQLIIPPPLQGGVRQQAGGGNDPAMIYEVIARRLKHAEWPMPEVMLIDGGPTQLRAALSARSQIHPLPAIKIVSLAKREEELYLSPHTTPIKIKQSSESLYSLLTHIRDESHRFAISHYRRAHRKIFTH